MKKKPHCPITLQKRGKKFWHDMLKEYEFSDLRDYERLRMAGELLDLMDEAQASIKNDGLWTTDRFGHKKEHPALRLLRNAQVNFIRLLKSLDIEKEISVAKQNGRLYGTQ